MKQVKVTDKKSPLFGEVGFLLKQSNGDYHTVSIKNVHYQLHRLAFRVMNRYTPKVESEIVVKLKSKINDVTARIESDIRIANRYPNEVSRGMVYGYSESLKLINSIDFTLPFKDVAVSIQGVKECIDKLLNYSHNFNTDNAHGVSIAYRQCSEMLDLILKG